MGKLALVILSTPRVCRDQVSCSQSQKCVFFLISLPRGFSVSLIFARTQLLESLVFLFGFSVLCFAALCSGFIVCTLEAQGSWCPSLELSVLASGFSPDTRTCSLGQRHGAILSSPPVFTLSGPVRC